MKVGMPAVSALAIAPVPSLSAPTAAIWAAIDPSPHAWISCPSSVPTPDASTTRRQGMCHCPAVAITRRRRRAPRLPPRERVVLSVRISAGGPHSRHEHLKGVIHETYSPALFAGGWPGRSDQRGDRRGADRRTGLGQACGAF